MTQGQKDVRRLWMRWVEVAVWGLFAICNYLLVIYDIHRGLDWKPDMIIAGLALCLAATTYEVIGLRRKRIRWCHTIYMGDVKDDGEIRDKVEEYRRRWSPKKEAGDAVESQKTEA